MATLWPIVRFEWRRTRRNFAPVFFALAFPVLMLCMFGGIYGNEPSEQFDGRGTVDMSVPAYLVLVVAVTGLMSFPLGLAEYRDRKVLKRFRATPVDASAFLIAQGLVNLALSLLGALLLVAAGYLFFDLNLPASPRRPLRRPGPWSSPPSRCTRSGVWWPRSHGPSGQRWPSPTWSTSP